MALFNRNKTDQAGMTPEVKDYYKAEGRQRTWVAWLLAVGTLLVTIFIVLGLFYGGRWTFRKLKGNDDKPAPVAVQTDDSKSEESKSKDQASTDSAPSASEQSSTSNNSSSSTSSASGTTSAPVNTASKSGGDLPNTGPGDTLAVFVAVSIFGYIAHRRFLAKV